MKYWQTTLAILAALAASIALADDFKTIDGKEYKNVKVSRVEPDGIVITFSGGIVKIPFTELSPDIQKKYDTTRLRLPIFKSKPMKQDSRERGKSPKRMKSGSNI